MTGSVFEQSDIIAAKRGELHTARLKAYEDAVGPLRDKFYKARGKVYKRYDKAIAPFEKVLQQELDKAAKPFEEARAKALVILKRQERLDQATIRKLKRELEEEVLKEGKK